jgi:hypothetical protein
MTTAVERGGCSAARPGRNLSPGKTRYPLYSSLGGWHGRSGEVRRISPHQVWGFMLFLQQKPIQLLSSYFKFTRQVSKLINKIQYGIIKNLDKFSRLQVLQFTFQATVTFTSYWNIFLKTTNFNTAFESLRIFCRIEVKYAKAQDVAFSFKSKVK